MAIGALVGGVAAPIIGGAIGQYMSQADKDKQREAEARALQELYKVNAPKYDYSQVAAPDLQELSDVQLRQYQSAGEFNPESVGQVDLGPSEMGNVYQDPRLKEAQLQALRGLQERGQGGFSVEEQAALQKTLGEASAEERANREAIMQNMRARGTASGGQELAAQLSNQQASANRGSQAALDIDAMAKKRALEATMQGGQLAGQIGEQDFSQAAKRAQARDAIAEFNARNAQSLALTNVGARNQAGLGNLTRRQDLLNANADMSNKQTMQNQQNRLSNNQVRSNMYNINQGKIDALNALRGQDFNAQSDVARMRAGGQGMQAQSAANRAQQTQQMWGGIGQGIGKGFSSYGANKKEDEDGGIF